jgi:hypothetical protein
MVVVCDCMYGCIVIMSGGGVFLIELYIVWGWCFVFVFYEVRLMVDDVIEDNDF